MTHPFRQKRTVVTGGRDYEHQKRLYRILDFLSPTSVAQGGCPTGADYFARLWCYDRKVPCVNYPADWKTYGRRAGPKRNQFMLEDYNPHLVVAFKGQNGTADCVARAIALQYFVWDLRQYS